VNSRLAELRRIEQITRCYGNQRRAHNAAYHKAKTTLLKRGYSDDDARGGPSVGDRCDGIN
jgi:hypothetical protein